MPLEPVNYAINLFRKQRINESALGIFHEVLAFLFFKARDFASHLKVSAREISRVSVGFDDWWGFENGGGSSSWAPSLCCPAECNPRRASSSCFLPVDN